MKNARILVLTLAPVPGIEMSANRAAKTPAAVSTTFRIKYGSGPRLVTEIPLRPFGRHNGRGRPLLPESQERIHFIDLSRITIDGDFLRLP